MVKVKVKICGIRNLEDARAAVAAGADALGFVFFRGSPRYVNPLTAARIIRQLPKRVKKIGVFVNARPATIKRYARQCSLDMAQLHGNESVKVCGRCAPFPLSRHSAYAGLSTRRSWPGIKRTRFFLTRMCPDAGEARGLHAIGRC